MENKTYFALMPKEINVIIATYMVYHYDIDKYLDLIFPMGNILEFNNIWKSMSAKNYYNPRIMKIRDHPLVMKLYHEFVKLNKLSGNGNLIRIRDNGAGWIIIYSRINRVEIVHIRIHKRDLCIYSRSTRGPIGCLYDSPWHGFDVIDSDGVIRNKSKLEARLKYLNDKH
jgi:hypothetical protein